MSADTWVLVAALVIVAVLCRRVLLALALLTIAVLRLLVGLASLAVRRIREGDQA